MRNTAYLMLLSFILIIAGCTKNAPRLKDDNNMKIVISQLKTKIFDKEWKEYNCLNDGYYNLNANMSPFDCQTVTHDTSTYSSTSTTNLIKDTTAAQDKRNVVVDNGIEIIDSAYDVYKRDIRKKRSVGEFLADLTELGTSSAIGITNGERALQIIGVALTGFRGSRKSAELNFYDQKLTSVLVSRMEASRNEIKGEILQSKAKTTKEYSFDAALGDLVRYFDAGTLNTAFDDLESHTSAEAEITRRGIVDLKGIDQIGVVTTKGNYDITSAVRSALDQLLDDTQDNARKDAATGVLKSVYSQIVAEAKFGDILTNFGNQNNGYNELTSTRQAAADQGIAVPPTLTTANDYYYFIDAVFSMTNTETDTGAVYNKPELRQLLLDFINKAKTK